MKILIALALALSLAAFPSFAADKADEAAIRAVLDAQEKAWNRGDIPAFMEGYWKSDRLRFASGGTVTAGWEAALASYQRRYPTPEKMGVLAFAELAVEMLSPDAALVSGRFALDRREGDLKGVFTLIFRKFDEGWRIVYDHTSEDVLPLSIVAK